MTEIKNDGFRHCGYRMVFICFISIICHSTTEEQFMTKAIKILLSISMLFHLAAGNSIKVFAEEESLDQSEEIQSTEIPAENTAEPVYEDDSEGEQSDNNGIAESELTLETAEPETTEVPVSEEENTENTISGSEEENTENTASGSEEENTEPEETEIPVESSDPEADDAVEQEAEETEEPLEEENEVNENVETMLAANVYETEDGIQYTVNTSTNVITITGYTGSVSELTIPSIIDGKNVTTINDGAFKGHSELTAVSLPSGLTTMGIKVFEGTAISSITVPASVTTAGNWVNGPFAGMEQLTTATVEEGMTALTANLFSQASSLTSVTLPDSLTSIGNYAFRLCTGLSSIDLPETVKTIGSNAFESCTGLTGITLPDTVTSIGNNAFKSCTGLTEVNLSAGLTSIGDRAFAGCTKITAVSLPSGLRTMGIYVFEDTAISSITVPASVTSADNWVNGPFAGMGQLTEATVEEGMTALPANLFSQASSLTSVTLPDSLTSIGNYAFRQCTGLSSIDLPETLKTIGTNVFESCTGLTGITLPDTVTSLGDNAFKSCTGLTEVNLSAGLTSIGDSAFAGCTKLAGISLPSGLKALGIKVFEGTAISSITVPASVTSASNWVNGPFAGMGQLTTATVEEGMTALPDNLFSQATSLKNITLPDSLTSIGSYAFRQCTGLSYLELPDRIASIKANFAENSNIKSILCNFQSYPALYSVLNHIPFESNGRDYIDSENNLVVHNHSDMYIGFDSSMSNSQILYVDYEIDSARFSDISNSCVNIAVGENIVYNDAVRIDGKPAAFNYDSGNNSIISIPVTSNKGRIQIQIKLLESSSVIASSYLTGRYGGKNFTEVIDSISAEFEGMAITSGDGFINTTKPEISGVTLPSHEVSVYVDGALAATVISKKNGSWYANIDLGSPENYRPFDITASAVDTTGKTVTASAEIVYLDSAPGIESFKMEYDQHGYKLNVDLLGGTIRPKIFFTPNQKFDFEVKMSNPESVENVYISSKRGNEEKLLPAHYDSSKGSFVTDGYFDPGNTRYVPGNLQVVYNVKSSLPDFSSLNESYDIAGIANALAVTGVNPVVNMIVNEERKVYAEVNFKDLFQEEGETMIETGIEALDSDQLSALEDSYKIYKIITRRIKGKDDDIKDLNIYQLASGETVMVVKDTYDILDKSGLLDEGIKAYAYTIKGIDDVYALEPSYKTEQFINKYSDKFANAGTWLKILSSQYDIIKDDAKLRASIGRSNMTYDQKIQAYRKADELKSDRAVFSVVTTVLAAALGGAAGGPPGIVFSGILGLITASSSFFFDLRSEMIEGKTVKPIWAIDPSGIIYDSITEEPIEGATVSAYWIEYDETDDFYDRVPADNVYGTLWDALEYEQENPMSSNVDGKYAWDVPEGWWRVKAEKEGYETVWSEWMTVPPVQTEVDLGMRPENMPIIPVKEITLDITEVAINKGETVKLTVTITPEDTTDDKTVTWTSSNEAVATVNDGTVTAVSGGTVTITAKVGEKTATAEVTVSVPIESISLDKSEVKLVKGGTETLTVTITPEDTTEDKTVTWTSSNEAVAAVNDGTVTAVSGGTVTITAKVGEKTATADVTVSVPLESISLDKSEVTLVKGKTEKLTLTITPEDTTEDKTVTWTSSNEAVAAVNDGTVTAVGGGTATITAKVGEKTATAEVTVIIPIEKISLDKSEAALKKGETVKLTVTITPEDTTEDKTVTWTSSDEAVATVNDGTVTAVGSGTATITAAVKDSDITAECIVTVDTKVQNVSLDNETATLNIGDSFQLTAEIIPEDATNKKVYWSSSNSETATVDDHGQVRAIAPGVADIKVVSEDNPEAYVTCKIRVQFTDVTDPSQFYYEYIYDMVDKGITTGYIDGTFRPTADCNRAAVVTFLWRLKGKPEPTQMATFKDMTGTSDFDKAISWASEKGITTGWEADNTFRPWNTCNRAAVMTFLWRAAGKPEPTQMATFKDMTGTSDFDKAISWASENGITTGWADNTFRPWNTCNRLAIASFLGRYASLN